MPAQSDADERQVAVLLPGTKYASTSHCVEDGIILEALVRVRGLSRQWSAYMVWNVEWLGRGCREALCTIPSEVASHEPH